MVILPGGTLNASFPEVVNIRTSFRHDEQLLARRVRVVGLGPDADADLRAEDVRVDAEGRVAFVWRGRDVHLALRGRHNARNALLAFAVGEAMGADVDAMIDAASAVTPPAMRSEIRRIGGLTVVVDCYNANPGSVSAAARLLADMPRGTGRVAVLGSMLELGPTSDALHRDSAAEIADLGLDRIVATGAFVEAFAPLATKLGDRLIAVADPIEAFDRLAPALTGGETILLKGSRGVALERLIPRLDDRWGVLHPHGETFGSRAGSSDPGVRRDASPSEHTPTDPSRGEG